MPTIKVGTIQKEKRNNDNLSIYKKHFYVNLNICILKQNSRNQETIHLFWVNIVLNSF